MSLTFTAPLRANKPKRNVGVISAGENFSLALQKNGRAWGWGRNGYGQLGDNSITSRRTPVSVLGAVKTFCQISAGQLDSGGHSLAIDKNGRAWAWGLNSLGQLGDNSITSRRTPVSILGAIKTFCRISAGAGHSFAIDKNGRAWGWGSNGRGQLGDNSITSRRTPVSVLGAIKTFCQISAGFDRTLAIDKNGRAWGWGYNGFGQIGDNSITSRRTPVSVAGAVKTFCRISGGSLSSLAIDKNGRAWAWGFNSSGQLGDNSITSRRTPVSVAGAVKTFCQISGGRSFFLAIDKNGRAWGWGYNTFGQLGDNSITSRRTPVSVAGAVKTFCQISAGNNHSLAIDKNGRAWGWGRNGYGQLGNNVFHRFTPVSVAGSIKTFCHISTSNSFGLVIDKYGRAWGWGSNDAGQLADNSITSRRTPVSILGAIKTFCRISSGGFHSLAIDKNGRAWAWGFNNNGRLGDNSIISRRTPVSVAGAVKTFCQISAGNAHSLAIDKNGQAWGWGYNGYGALGDNSTTSRLTPVSVAGAVKTFCQISADFEYSLAIDKNGRAWGWGYNYGGQLGDNSLVQKLTPVSVAGQPKTFCQISGATLHSLAIDKNGRVWGWGSQPNGQIGNNSTTQHLTPVSVAGAVKTFCQISAGANHSLAIDKNNRAWAWGLNNLGQLGDNSITSRRTPVSVAGAVKTFCQISAGANHSLAIDKNGRAWGWGSISNGRLGNNEDLIENTPVRICNI